MKSMLKFLSLCATILLAACGTQNQPVVEELPTNFGQAEVELPGFKKPQKVTYEIVDGKAIFEGDIILGNVDAKGKLIRSESQIDPQGVATDTGCFGHFRWSDCRWRWPGGVVPFTISGNWDDPTTAANEDDLMRGEIIKAINHWQDRTSIRLVPRTNEGAFIDFVKGSGCASSLGMGGRRQVIVLERTNLPTGGAEGCFSGEIIHEIGHAIGLHHEQSREDRYLHVAILLPNIESGKEHNFNQFVSTSFDIGSYDFRSIMHYGCTDFGITVNGVIQTTIIPINPPPGVSCTAIGMNQIGQRIGLSDGDIAAVNRIYPSYSSLGPALAPGSGVGTATTGNNHEYLDVFVRGTDNALYHRWREDGQQWSNWEYLGGVDITSDPAAVGRGHRVDAFARGTNGELWSIYYAGGWSNWESLGGCLAPGSGASAVATGNDTITLFVRWCNDELYQRFFDGQNWGPWSSMGSETINSDPAAVVSGNTLSVFIRGTDNQLYQKLQICRGFCVWSMWMPLGGVLSSGPAATALSPNTIGVYARGTDNKLHQIHWNGSRWTGWTPLGGSIVSSDPDAIAWAGRSNVFVRGTDGELWYRWQDSAGWWPQLP